MDVFLNNFDTLDSMYIDYWRTAGHIFPPPLNWKFYGTKYESRWDTPYFLHLVSGTSGDTPKLYETMARRGYRAKQFYEGKFITFNITSMDPSIWSLQFRAVMAIALLTNRTLILPATMGETRKWPTASILDVSLFAKTWSEPRPPYFLELTGPFVPTRTIKYIWFGNCEQQTNMKVTSSNTDIICSNDSSPGGPNQQFVEQHLLSPLYCSIDILSFDHIEFGTFNNILDTYSHDIRMRDCLSYCHPTYFYNGSHRNRFGDAIGRLASRTRCISDYKHNNILIDQIFHHNWRTTGRGNKMNKTLGILYERETDHNWWVYRPWKKQ
jgi:hypothetical protein